MVIGPGDFARRSIPTEGLVLRGLVSNGLRSGGLRIRRGQLRVLDAIAENQSTRERFDLLNLGRDKKSRLSGREWRGNFDQGIELVLLQAVEADATLGYVLALDDFVCVSWVAHAGAETHANANGAPLVDGPSVCIKLSRGNVLELSRGRATCVAGRAIAGSGACSTAVATATTAEV